MKTCSTCQHYYATRQICEAPLPLWLDNYDPIGTTASDAHTTMEPDTDATGCTTYRKRRMPGNRQKRSGNNVAADLSSGEAVRSDDLLAFYEAVAPFLRRLREPRFDREETNDYVCGSTDCKNALDALDVIEANSAICATQDGGGKDGGR